MLLNSNNQILFSSSCYIHFIPKSFLKVFCFLSLNDKINKPKKRVKSHISEIQHYQNLFTFIACIILLVPDSLYSNFFLEILKFFMASEIYSWRTIFLFLNKNFHKQKNLAYFMMHYNILALFYATFCTL